jgi:NAD(P)H-hydrate repair Nnr-like enzyme with NAD(P)H-hydrate dehydratase domain
MKPYWHKQAADKPLFPELLWSRPENKRQAGKLLIVGGNLHGFAAPAEAYQAATTAGIGTAKVMLPDALKKAVGPIIENGEYAPSTPSGSFSQKSLSELLELASWSDAVLLAGDFGRNSETAILLEKFLEKSSVPTVLTKDSIDYFNHLPQKIFKRNKTTLVITMAQLQRLCKGLGYPKPVRFGMDLLALVELLHELTEQYKAAVIVKHLNQMVVTVQGQVSTLALAKDMPIWRVKTAAAVSVWWLQNPTRPFEALSTALLADI